MKRLLGGQGILIAGRKVTMLNRKSKNQLPPLTTVNFPGSNFEHCNASWNNNQIWCTIDYTKVSILISSIPIIDRFITFQKNRDIWKLALTYSNTPVITCVAPPYTLLFGSINIGNSSKGGYNISCVNCIFSSCMFPSAGTQSVLILKQPMYVMVPVHLREPWYEDTGVQAWVEVSKALQRRRFLGWLIVSLLASAALSATVATAGLALSQSINHAHFANQLSQHTSLALSLQSHIYLRINNKLDEFKNAILGIGDQMAALKLRMRLACHAKYTWMCVTP